MARIVLAMSGGVDSSVAAQLLLDEGHEVIGVFMRHGEASAAACEVGSPVSVATGGSTASPGSSLLPLLTGRSDHKQGCCSAADAEDARRVADRLGIPFYALDLQAEFRQIVDYFVAEYVHGRTPNPCVMCNTWIKFGRLFDYADSVHADRVATGHYARIARVGDECQLLRGVDPAKDQSYALFGIRREYLSRMALPVGGFSKPTIRRRAAELGLSVAEKRDSQEICFVTSGRHGDFVRQREPGDRSGRIVTTDGRVVGEHAGIENFTIGQRKGLGVAMGERWFVTQIDPQTRDVIIGPHDELLRWELTAARCNWLAEIPRRAFHCHVKIRYNSEPAPAEVECLAEDQLRVRFDAPRFGVAPGQAVVCYAGDRLLGGGWIETASGAQR